MKFSEVAVGQVFRFNNEEFLKIEPVKVNCCTSHNARGVVSGAGTMIKPDADVELVA